MVNEIVGDTVLAALPQEDGGRVGLDFSNMMDVVVLDDVVMTEVFCAGTVAGDEDAGAAEVLDVI